MIPVPARDRTWTPDLVPASIARSSAAPGSGPWLTWLRGQGYTDDEVTELLRPSRGDSGKGLVQHTALAAAHAREVAERDGVPFTTDDLATARGAAVRAYLEARPPELIEALDPRPPVALSPAALGARLRREGDAPELGAELWRDRLTGRPWWVRRMADEVQRRQVVIAGVLYREVGVAAAEWRLVQLAGVEALACPAPSSWATFGAVELGRRYGADLARELAADAWLGNQRLLEGTRARELAIAGTANLLRLDLVGCLAFRAEGVTSAPRDFAAGAPADLDRALEAKAGVRAALYATAQAEPELVQQGLARVAAMTDDQVAAAIRPGGLPPAAAGDLHRRLLARRDALAARITKR